MHIYKRLAILLVGFLPLIANAEIYSWVDENGVRHFSDKPPQGADRSRVTGDIKRKAAQSPINSMLPFKPVPVPAAVEEAAVSEPVVDDGSENSADRKPGQKKGNSSLKNLDQQKSGYSVQKRVAEIKAEKAQKIADKKAIQEGTKTKDFSKPDKLSKKLTDYNNSKSGSDN